MKIIYIQASSTLYPVILSISISFSTNALDRMIEKDKIKGNKDGTRKDYENLIG